MSCGSSDNLCSNRGECTGRFGCRCREGFGGSFCETPLPPATAIDGAASSPLPIGGSVAVLPTAIAAGIVFLFCVACVLACCVAVRRGRRRQDPAYFDERTGRPLPARRVIRQKVSRTLRSTFDLSGQRVPAPDAKRRAANDQLRRDTESAKSQAARDADDVALVAMGLKEKPTKNNNHNHRADLDSTAARAKPLPSTNPELAGVDDDIDDSLNWALVAQGKQRPSLNPDDTDSPPAASAAKAHHPPVKQRTDSHYEKVPPQLSSNAPIITTTTTATTTTAAVESTKKATAAAKANNRLSSAPAPAAAAAATNQKKRSSLAMPPVPPDMPLTLELPTIDLDLGAAAETRPAASFRVDEPPPTPPHELHDDDDNSSAPRADHDNDDDELPVVPDMVRSPSPPAFDVTGAPYDVPPDFDDNVAGDDDDDDLPPVPDGEPPPFQPLDIDLV